MSRSRNALVAGAAALAVAGSMFIAPPASAALCGYPPVTCQPVRNPAGITPAQASQLNAAQVASIPPTQLRRVDPDVFAALRPNQVGRLSNAQVRSITAAQISAITPTAFAGMNARQLSALTTRQKNSLTKAQIAALSPAQRRALNG